MVESDDDEPQPVAHQVYMMEQDDDDDDWYTWGSVPVSESVPEPPRNKNSIIPSIVITTQSIPGNFKSTGEEDEEEADEDEIQTEAWDNTYKGSFEENRPNEIEDDAKDMNTDQSDAPSTPYAYQQSAEPDGSEQFIHFMGNAATDIRELQKNWHDEEGPFDPLAWGNDKFMEVDYMHPYDFEGALYTTVYSEEE